MASGYTGLSPCCEAAPTRAELAQECFTASAWMWMEIRVRILRFHVLISSSFTLLGLGPMLPSLLKMDACP